MALYSFGSITKREAISDVPGPGHYDQFQSDLSEKKLKIPMETSEIEKERKELQQSAILSNRSSKNFPGPGTYPAFSEFQKNKQGNNSYSLKKIVRDKNREKNSNIIKATPGPGAYDPKNPFQPVSKSFGYSFGRYSLGEGIYPMKDPMTKEDIHFTYQSSLKKFPSTRFAKKNSKPQTAKNKIEDTGNESQNVITSNPKFLHTIFPGPDKYSPKLDDPKYKYSLRNREKFGTISTHEFGPGPDHYERYRPIFLGYSGYKKSMGGSRNEIKSDMNPEIGPGKYNPNEVMGFKREKIIYTPNESIRPNKFILPGPGNADPKIGNYLNKKVPIDFKKSARGSVTQKLITPAPGKHQKILPDQNEILKIGTTPSYSFGMKTTRDFRKLITPSPAHYNILDSNSMKTDGPAFVFGTGERAKIMSPSYSDAIYTIVPNENTISKIGFIKSRKDFLVQKSYDPGPGSYNLPSTVGVIPQYVKKTLKTIKIIPIEAEEIQENGPNI